MSASFRRPHVFRLFLATLAIAVVTAGPASADGHDPSICLELEWPRNFCVHWDPAA